VRWKNEQCMPFDKEPWSDVIVDIGRGETGGDGERKGKVMRKVGFEEAMRKKQAEMMTDPDEWEHKFGTAPLTEIWEMGYRDLVDLQQPFQCVACTPFLSRLSGADRWWVGLAKLKISRKRSRWKTRG